MKTVTLMILLMAAFSASSATKKTTSKAYEKISLQVGAQRPVKWERVAKVSVSRRGIIHILDQDSDTWHVTGLRTGVVAVTLQLKGGDRKIVYVEVVPRPILKSRTSANVFHTSTEILPDTERAMYRCKAKVELLETQELESIGASPKSGLAVDFVSQKISPTAAGGYAAKGANATKRVLASPLFLLSDGEEAEIKSGGETIHQRTNDDGTTVSVWHEYGMNLTVKITEKSPASHRAEVLFVLKTPTADGGYSLNQIQTASKLKLGQNQLVGTVDLSTADESKARDLLLSKVPIIGPLFQSSTSSSAKATLRLWLEITKE